MATLAEIKKQIAELEKKAEAMIKAESAQAIAKVKELIDRYGLSAEDLGFAGKRGGKSSGKRAAAKTKKSAVGSVGVPMYRDPVSGKTWTGRGKPPTWIAGAKDRARFLIDASGATASTEDNAAARSTRAKVAKAKPARAAKKAAPKTAKKGAARKVANAEAAATAPATKKAGATSKKAPKKTAGAPNRKAARKAGGAAAVAVSSASDTTPATVASA